MQSNAQIGKILCDATKYGAYHIQPAGSWLIGESCGIQKRNASFIGHFSQASGNLNGHHKICACIVGAAGIDT